jgi:hypothetical protein
MISLFSAIPVVSEQVLRPNRCPSRPCRDAALARVNRLTIRSTIITNLADKADSLKVDPWECEIGVPLQALLQDEGVTVFKRHAEGLW